MRFLLLYFFNSHSGICSLATERSCSPGRRVTSAFNRTIIRRLLRNNLFKSVKPNTLILFLHRCCLNLFVLPRRLVFDPTPLSQQAQIPTISPVSSGSPPLVRVPSLHTLARLAPGTPSRSSPNCNTVARSCAPSPSPPMPALSASVFVDRTLPTPSCLPLPLPPPVEPPPPLDCCSDWYGSITPCLLTLDGSGSDTTNSRNASRSGTPSNPLPLPTQSAVPSPNSTPGFETVPLPTFCTRDPAR